MHLHPSMFDSGTLIAFHNPVCVVLPRPGKDK